MIFAVELPAALTYGGGVTAILSFVGLVLRSIWDSGAARQKAYIDGRKTAEETHAEELRQLKREFQDKLNAQDERHNSEIHRIHEALAELISLIPTEHAAKATAIIVKLSIQPPPPPPPEGA